VRIVSIAPFVPYPGIPHAGGEYYRRHAELVSEGHDLVVVSPRTRDNELALECAPVVPYRRLLVEPRGPRGPLARLASRAVPFLSARPFVRACLTDERVTVELRAADRVELQWFSSVILAPWLRRDLPDTPLIGVFHDVVSQGHVGRLTSAHLRLRSRAVALLRFLVALPLERRAMRVLQTAVVLSDKDGTLLRRRGGSARVLVVSPPLDSEDMPTRLTTDRPSEPRVLFVGALGRPENHDAGMWLLREIWPRVRSAVPGTRLTLAGAGARPSLVGEAARRDGVEVTGYVDDLGPHYRQASVAVAPLRMGAGVKLKCITAMLWGVPVVATCVGAEGVNGPELFVAVEDDADRFAEAVVGVLRDPASAAEVRIRAHDRAHRTYTTQAYRRTLERFYG
jgi:glycosyltransferase involved in cell wall biosynthesis